MGIDHWLNRMNLKNGY